MEYRKTLYLDFLNIQNSFVGHTVYSDSHLTDDGFEIFELYKSEASDDWGINFSRLGVSFFHFAIDENGIPYAYDINAQEVVPTRFSDTTCRLNGTPYVRGWQQHMYP